MEYGRGTFSVCFIKANVLSSFSHFFYTSECGSRGFNRCFINVIVSCFTSICFILITRFLFFFVIIHMDREALMGNAILAQYFFFLHFIKKRLFLWMSLRQYHIFKPPFLYLMNFLLQFYLLTDRHRQRWWWLRGIRLWIGMIGDGYP